MADEPILSPTPSPTPTPSPSPGPDAPLAPNPPPTPASGAPEAYTDFTAPEGRTLDPEVTASAKATFKELGLTQDQAQKLIELHATQQATAETKQMALVTAMREGWRAEVDKDPAMAGKATEIKAEVGKALARLPAEVSTKFREAMDFTGAGDHPAFVRAFYEMSKLLNEGTHIAPGGPSPAGQIAPGTPTRPSAASAMYPNLS